MSQLCSCSVSRTMIGAMESEKRQAGKQEQGHSGKKEVFREHDHHSTPGSASWSSVKGQLRVREETWNPDREAQAPGWFWPVDGGSRIKASFQVLTSCVCLVCWASYLSYVECSARTRMSEKVWFISCQSTARKGPMSLQWPPGN